MSELTHKDKLDLNRRARAHGLPDLWPEYVKIEVEMLYDPEDEIRLAEGHMDLLGLNIRGAEALRVSRELVECPAGGVVMLPRGAIRGA